MSEKTSDQAEDSEPEDNRTFEEKFKAFVEKVRPFTKRLWAKRKKLAIVNFSILILALAYLFIFSKTLLRKHGYHIARIRQ